MHAADATRMRWSEVPRAGRGPHPPGHASVMAHQRPTDDLRGTEPARQTDDPGLSDRPGDPAGAAGPVISDSRPGVIIGLAVLGLFLVGLVGAVAAGLIR